MKQFLIPLIQEKEDGLNQMCKIQYVQVKDLIKLT